MLYHWPPETLLAMTWTDLAWWWEAASEDGED